MIDLAGFSFLVVDDSPVNQAILLHRLSRLGGAVSLAANGNEALAQCASCHFDLVFLDIQMPELDGFATAEHLKRLYPDMKVIAWTCSVDESQICFFDAGFDGQLDKPIHKQSFLAIITSHLELTGDAAVSDQMNADFVISELVAHSREMLVAHTGFIAALPHRIEELTVLLEARKWEELTFQVRKLRGTAKLNGLAHLADTFRTIERAAQDQNPGPIAQPLQTLASAVKQHLESQIPYSE